MLARLALALALLTPCVARADWPLARGDARMLGVADVKLSDQLDEVWAFKAKDTIESAPLIVGGVVYFTSFDKHLYAVDLATGKEKWKRKLGSLKASAGYDGGRVYVGDLEGKLHAVDAKTGEPVWTFETQGEIHAAPNFVDGDILIGSHDATLYRVSKPGKKVWEFRIDGPVNGAAAVADGKTFVAGCDSLMHVVDVATGKSLGSVELGGQAAATAAVVGDTAYVGTMTNQVLAVDMKAKKMAWTFEAKRRQQPFYSSAAVAGDLVVIGGRDKRIYALDRVTGKEKWSYIAEGSIDASPVVSGGRVYVGSLSNTGEFYVLNLADGKLVQSIMLDGPIASSASIGPDCVLVGTDRGTLYKLGKK